MAQPPLSQPHARHGFPGWKVVETKSRSAGKKDEANLQIAEL
jgi:hypothetical protein